MIVIPMAGLSSRFFKAGYTEPKYMLMAHGETLFAHAVKSFEKYFRKEKFIFIVSDSYDTKDFVDSEAVKIGVKDYDVIVINKPTRGQAETVTLGLEIWKEKNAVKSDCQITIFNIDTFRPSFVYPDLEKLGCGYLEVFQGEGDNWSFVKPKSTNSTLVKLTAEKKPISDLCCTGLYHFSSMEAYFDAYYDYLQKPIDEWEKGELYVAPLYNYFIGLGLEIHYNLIQHEEVIFCGIPQEYTDFVSGRKS
ncbi:glycosyltransferase family 2 protein [Grimontia sp. SpTr1]|uniref:glycosyltransferase family 2 protein n=1 Tax=Grimontia sp. SpTr1 TaxID=2995319 RepID=UPI00248AA19B|nr:glycosyltransferase family 2 protein [Grimontia sp. SpTr1]